MPDDPFLLCDNLEIERIQKGEPKKEGETYLDLFTAKNVRVKERVLIPVKQYPRVSGYMSGLYRP